jgi:hypothetical protein
VPVAERAAVAGQLFGEEGSIAMSRIDTATLRQATDDVRAFGVVVSEQDADQIERTNDAISRGKLNVRDLVTSLIADLAKLGARRFILGPLSDALGSILGRAGGLFANVMHAGGIVGAPAPARMVPALAFAGAPRMHSGGAVGLRHDEVPAILQRGERVLSRREAQAYGGGGVNVTIVARNAESFRQSRTQVAADIARAVSLGRRGL